MGSHTQVTEAPEAVTFSTMVGSASRIRPAPMRVMKVSRPGSRLGVDLVDEPQQVVDVGFGATP